MVPKGYRCPLCPDHQDDEDEFVWSKLLQVPICHACSYDIVNGFEGWRDAPTPEQYNHADTIDRILQLTGFTFQQAKFKFMLRQLEEWSGAVPQDMTGVDPRKKTDLELKEWNAILDFQMALLRQNTSPAGNCHGVLDWLDVTMAMAAVLKDWGAPDGQEWLKGAWEKIVAAGQADYGDELEYTAVALRLIAMFDFYREFCDFFADGYGIPSEENVARALKVEKQNVMLLIGIHGSYDEFFRNRFWEQLFFDGAVSYLCEESFSGEVQTTLLRGGSSAKWLFATLLSSVEAPTPVWWREDSFDPADETRFGDDCYAEQVCWYRRLYSRWQSVCKEYHDSSHATAETVEAAGEQSLRSEVRRDDDTKTGEAQ
ncbi:hypothetical protein GEOBRER4_n2795 [Citrifermentans bremense]|uniref:Uncharacterized protein n=2 Tax=Citrifermentans bremense TaxID=60035 RepID=A0A6S6M0R1_9BACT|nr:hypothetical protein GEOBRER4_n2795 [Citrifermentans bremense]